MCGICGVVHADPRRPVDRARLEGMTAVLSHRGPDGSGVHVEPGMGLGVRRLSIIDLERGDQPLANEDGTVVVACNGEIYNSPELRVELEAKGHRFRSASDVEVIVHLYEDLGVACVHRLRGMFGFAVWDSPRRRLMLARDRLGIKPLHYACTEDGLYFASELKAILDAGVVEREPDLRALNDLFTFGFVRAPKTLSTEIRRLLPGHYLLYQGGVPSIHPYWRPRFPRRGEESREMSAGAWAELLRAKMEECVRLHLRSDVPLGAWLSSGIDSSAIASLASRLTSGRLRTFSLAFDNPAYDEVGRRQTLDRFQGYNVSNERFVCDRTAFDLYPKALWHCEDPSASALEIPGMILARGASQSLKVVLTGEGSDELFGGYRWFWLDRLLRPIGALPLPLRQLVLMGGLIPRRWPRTRLLYESSEMTLARYRQLITWLPPESTQGVFSADLAQRMNADTMADGEPPTHEDIQAWHPFAQLQYYEMTVRLPNLTVHVLDRTSMAYGVEARVPFLDHELVELCARIPPHLKMRGWTEKYILRRALRGALPREILRRRKRGLRTPYGQWLREKLPGFAADLLSRERLLEKGYFNPERVRTLLERHRAGVEGYAGVLMAVLGIQLWDELFVRGRRAFDGQ